MTYDLFYKAPDGRIIIYGGSNDPYKVSNRAIPDLVVLNVQTTQFEWTIPGEFQVLV